MSLSFKQVNDEMLCFVVFYLVLRAGKSFGTNDYAIYRIYEYIAIF